MKKIKVIGIALSLCAMSFVSCQKDQLSVAGPKLSVSFEQMEAEEDEKTLYDPVSGNFYWKSSDKLMVYDSAFRNIVYTDPQADGNYDYNTHTFSGHTNFISFQPSYAPSDITGYNAIDERSSNYYAFYPSYYVSRVNNVFVYNIPHKQLIDNNENVDKIDQMHLTRFPMARQTTSHTFNMKNMCGALRLNLTKSGVAVKSIQFRTLGDQQVTGDFTVTFDTVNEETGIPILNSTTVNSTTKTFTLEMNQPVSIAEGHSFFIPLPPATYNGYEIIITDATNRTSTITSNKDLVIKRNGIKRLTLGETIFTGTRAFKESHGRFSISSTEQVYIAPGNLQWFNGNWQFANEQFEVMTLGCNAAYTPDEFNGDLFRYSLEKQYANKPYDQYQTYWDRPATSRDTTGENNNYGRSLIEAEYTSTQDYANRRSISQVYRNWGLAFGDNSPWMVLSSDEYMYLVNSRQNNGKCHCTVGGVSNASYCRIIVLDDYGVEHPGLLLFPDSWENGYTDASIRAAIPNWKTGWVVNRFGSAWSDHTMMMGMHDYRILEEAGCAFLPAAGAVANNGYSLGGTLQGLCIDRGENNTGTYDGRCYYWTRDYERMTWIDDAAINQNGTLFTMENNGFSTQNWNKNTYASVRLFMRVPTSSTNN